MEFLFEGLFKIVFWIFKPLFKAIAWVFSSIFKAIGNKIERFVARKTKEVATGAAVTVGVGVAAAGATVIAEEVNKTKQKRRIRAYKRKGVNEIQMVDVLKEKLVDSDENNSYITNKEVLSDGMSYKRMEVLLGTKEEILVSKAFEYWKALDTVDTLEYLSFKDTMWS